jgi:NAD(P)-dependent dehydrogenase (short-subunit alcohol dehydrogenase family)
MNKSILITGANTGIGKDTARQLALINGTEKIYLACRNQDKAKAAKLELEKSTGKKIFEILIMDVSSIASVRSSIASLIEPIDALIMNAGGTGGKRPRKKTEDGVTTLTATNLIGHVVLLDELLKRNMLKKVALFAGSEAGRGIPIMGMKRPKLKTSSVDEFASICDGSFYGKRFLLNETYGAVKYVGTLWMSSMARKYPNIRMVTFSPGNTSGTEVYNNLPAPVAFFINKIASRILPIVGLMHGVDKGAARFVDGINNDNYTTGLFYASKASTLTGPVVDQSPIFSDLKNEFFQDNANEAIHRFIQ